MQTCNLLKSTTSFTAFSKLTNLDIRGGIILFSYKANYYDLRSKA